MKDSSKSLFKGMIKIGKHAKASESYLAGHAILLDKEASLMPYQVWKLRPTK